MPKPESSSATLSAVAGASLHAVDSTISALVLSTMRRSSSIFLDVDGVLRPARAGGFDIVGAGTDGETARTDTSDFFPSAVKALRHIVERTGAIIVLSSEWRRNEGLRSALTEILEKMSVPVDLTDREQLIKAASTSLNSKVISNNAALLAPLAVDAMLSVIDPATATNVDLRDIAVVKKLGGTIDDTELVPGLVFTQRIAHTAGGPTKVKDAKIGLIQFCLSAPKTDIEQNVVVSDYSQMDRILKEERKYILDMCKKISKSGCNVLLIQKSILRDAVNELSLHFLAKMKILVIKDIERDDIEFICKTCGCLPVANIDTFHAEKLGKADLVEEVSTGEGKVVKVTGVPNAGKTVSLLCKASNKLVLDESERSLHDALCVLRCLVKKRFLTPGGGAPEMRLSYQLSKWSNTLVGIQQYCIREFAEAMEVVPYTLAENAGLDAIQVVTELRNRHHAGEVAAGINVRKGRVSNILEENVFVPLLVHTSAINLATECVRLILKIDDIVVTR